MARDDVPISARAPAVKAGGSLQRDFETETRPDFGLHREGRPGTAYSLRHTYICLRLMEGADIYQIAKNCRTSVEMIEKYYASHIKTSLDAAAINIMRPKPKMKPKPTGKPSGENTQHEEYRGKSQGPAL
jgi:hypothetical protein